MKKTKFVELWILGNLASIFSSIKEAQDYINTHYSTYAINNFEIREII